VDVEFAMEFDVELGSTWRLIDAKENKHQVSYNKNIEDPRMNVGWNGLRSFYGLTGDHSLYLRYLGESIFEVTIWTCPCSRLSTSGYGRS